MAASATPTRFVSQLSLARQAIRASEFKEIAGQGLGVGMVYWTLEVIELFMRSAAPDVAERERLVHASLARFAPIRGCLSGFQRAAVRSLGKEFGCGADAGTEPASGSGDFPASRLEDKTIAIYSLVENASRQAKVALETMSPNVDVQIRNDHGGTSRLRALATNSDLFMIVWAAAKHAATDFIRDHRGNRPLVYAEGKGVSSLLRAVEGFLSEPAD